MEILELIDKHQPSNSSDLPIRNISQGVEESGGENMIYNIPPTENVNDNDDDDSLTLSYIPNSKQASPLIYSIEQLLALKDEVESIDFTDRLPNKLFYRMKPSRDQPPVYKNKKTRKHSNETWERGGGRYGHGHNNNVNHGSSYNQHYSRSSQQELDSLSNEKISQLLGEIPDEVAPEWDDIGGLNNSEGQSNPMLKMGETVEDFEKWKYQMKLEERRRNGEVIADELDNNPALNAGNEVDNFFSFVKQTPKDDQVDDLIPSATTINNVNNSNSLGTSSSTTQTSSSMPNRSSRFSSFFHSDSTTDNKKVNTPETTKPTVTKPPPGFSKFFGDARNISPPDLPTHQENRQVNQQIPSQIPGSFIEDPKSSQSTNQPLQMKDSFFLSLLNKKDSKPQSPTTSKSTPNNEGLAALFPRKNSSSILQPVTQSPVVENVSPTMIKEVHGKDQKLNSQKSTPKQDSTPRTQNPPPSQHQGPHHQSQQQQFQHFPGDIPPWLRGPPPPPGMNNNKYPLPPAPPGMGPNKFPPGFQFQQQPNQQPPNQQPPNQIQPNQQPPNQQPTNKDQPSNEQPRFFPPFQNQRNMPPIPPPGMFPNGFMPPPNFPPGANFPPGFGPNPNQMPPQFMNNPNGGRFVPPQYNMNVPQQQQQQPPPAQEMNQERKKS